MIIMCCVGVVVVVGLCFRGLVLWGVGRGGVVIIRRVDVRPA
jgi:hypothetical protein